jgi:hypothetical protein
LEIYPISLDVRQYSNPCRGKVNNKEHADTGDSG